MSPIIDSFAKDALALAARHDMFPQRAVVLALVSGGADSVALLRLLADGSLGDLGALEALHVNHLLRGAESDADEEFVVALCSELGVPCRAVRYDVAAYAADEGLNLEDAGRRVRYRFAEEELDAMCEAAGVTASLGRIAVAHSLDDRVETFFMRAMCGAGAGGLASIAPVRGRIVRPLLGTHRAEIRAWLSARAASDVGSSEADSRPAAVGWREDASNLDTDRRRALVRHELVPLAESVNPRFRETLARSMDLLADDDALLSEMAGAFAHDFVGTGKGAITFDRTFMRTLSRPMARRTVREALIRAFPEASRLEFDHVEALVDGLGRDAFARDLPGGLRAFSEYANMVVERTGEEALPVAPALLPVPGIVDLGDAGRVSASDGSPDDVSGTPDSVVIDASGLGDSLVVDAVRPGDRMRPFGMEGTRKLSDMLVDAKVPSRRRLLVPVVRDGERVVWLAGVRMSEEYRIGPDSHRAVRLTWERPESS
jgi:tRNA(Ile)-lysidine synthase